MPGASADRVRAPAEKALRLLEAIRSGLREGRVHRGPAAIDQRIGTGIVAAALALDRENLEVQLARKPPDDLVLNAMPVGRVALDPAGPHRRAAGGIDQLDVHAQLVALHPGASFQDVSHLEFGADGREIDGPVLEAARGRARNHPEGPVARQHVDEVVGHHVGDELRSVCWVARRLDMGRERQNNDRDDAPARCRDIAGLPPGPGTATDPLRRSGAGIRARRSRFPSFSRGSFGPDCLRGEEPIDDLPSPEALVSVRVCLADVLELCPGLAPVAGQRMRGDPHQHVSRLLGVEHDRAVEILDGLRVVLALQLRRAGEPEPGGHRRIAAD